MAKKVSASAKVRMVVEVHGLGSWGEECQLAQIHKQAKEAAVSRLKRETKSDAEAAVLGRSFTIIGEPEVIAIFTEEER